MDRRYTGEDVDVTYDAVRCIHAAECVRRLHQVFDKQKRPWIMADAAPADQVVEVVSHCPSGALHTHRKDGGVGEQTQAFNSIHLWKDGPLQFTGDLEIVYSETSTAEIRATLCRCGGSANKPFCDNTHRQNGFQAIDSASPQEIVITGSGGKLKVASEPNGPIHVEGFFEIRNAQGDLIFAGEEAWFCRCGGSSNKPFCDDTHKNGFKAE